ncbi:AMIN domain-containing protein [bacterium]|nr:MAG: AMIN domain-containing protein [bacterium]
MNRHIAVPHFLRALVLATVAALSGGYPAASALAAEPTATLQDVKVQPLPGQRLEIALKMSGNAPQPLAFTIDNPARISFDLPNTALALASRRIDVRQAGLDSIVAAEASGRSRLVLNLDRLLPYQTRVAGDTIFITLGEGAQAGPATAAASVSDAPSAPSRPMAGAAGRSISSLDFRRGNDGAGEVDDDVVALLAKVDRRARIRKAHDDAAGAVVAATEVEARDRAARRTGHGPRGGGRGIGNRGGRG